MIRVLHIVTSLSASGVPSVLYSFYSHMDRSKVKFDFVAIPSEVEQTYKAKFEALGSMVYYMPKAYSKRVQYLYHLIKKGNYDVVHSHIELASAIYLSIAKIAGVNVRIAHAHMAFLSYKKIHQRCLRFLLNRVSTIKMGCSIDALKGLFGTMNGIVLHNAIDTEKFTFKDIVRNQYRKKLEVDGNAVIGFVGRLTYQKNIFYLLDIFYEYLKINSNAVLLIAGDGEDREKIIEKAKRMGIFEKIKFLGPRNDINALMMAMDCLLLPSRWEGLGIVLVEAQAAALKCYTSLNTVPYEDTNISEYINYIDINSSPIKWAKCLSQNNITEYKRKSIKEQLAKHHYDIVEEANNLFEIYSNKIDRK